MYNFNLHIDINITSNLHVNVKSKTNLKSEFFLEVFGYKLFANFCTRSQHKKYLFAYNEDDGNKCFFFYSSDTKIAVKP